MLNKTKGTYGRVYGGNPDLVHIPDGLRKFVGKRIAKCVDREMRNASNLAHSDGMSLCPGCYMVAIVNAAIALADGNGQSRTELARSLAEAFRKVADNPQDGMTEEITVMLDPE